MDGDGVSSRALRESGWAELAQGRWAAARASFERAQADQQTAESAEGLSWAGWWLDEADTAFSARERAFRLYRDAGDPAGAARMATWLAVDHLDFHGAVAVTEGWLHRARRLLQRVGPSAEHGWLAFMEGYLAYAGGDPGAAVQRARTVSELGHRFGVPDLQVLGLALEGAALVAMARVDAGMRCLDEAAAAALVADVRNPISGAWACCFLVSACSSVLDYQRADQWCDRVLEFAERYGSRYMLAFCRAEYGAVHLWRGNWAQAETLLEAAVEDFRRSRPAWATAPTVWLAELRRRQGRAAEAEELLDRAGADTQAQVCRARLVLDAGDPSLAAESMVRLLRRQPGRDRIERFAALDLLVRARLARAETEEATAALEDLRHLERCAGTLALHATVDLLEGMVEAGRGEHTAARRLLEDAVDGLEAAGGAFEAARARIELASTLVALGCRELAEHEAVTALDVLLVLGARAETARARDLLHRLGSGPGSRPALTPREHEVLCLLVEGLTNREIAERLVVSEHTVHRHISNVLRKLGLTSRTAAAAHAVRSGLSPT